MYTTARDHTRPCARYTHVHARFTRTTGEPTVQPHLTSLTEEKEEEEEEEEDEGWWMGVSFRSALTFSHTPARSPLAPESSREPNLALLRSPPPLRSARTPLRGYIEPPPPPAPRFPAEAQSECFVIIPPRTPSPPSPTPRAATPGSPSIYSPPPTPRPVPVRAPSPCPKAPRQIHSQPRTHLEFPL